MPTTRAGPLRTCGADDRDPVADPDVQAARHLFTEADLVGVRRGSSFEGRRVQATLDRVDGECRCLVSVDREGTDVHCRQLRHARLVDHRRHDVGVGLDVGVAEELVVVHAPSRRCVHDGVEAERHDARADEAGHADDPGRQ